MQGVVDDIRDVSMDAYETSISPEFLGGVGGIVAGAMVSGILASQLSFSSTIGQVASSGGILLIGAGIYGYGLSRRVMNPALRSATQITGVVVGGVGLGRLLTSFGAPSFGLGLEDSMGLPDPDDGRIVGQDYGGRTLGQSAEEDDGLDRSNTDYQENWNNTQNAEETVGSPQVDEADPEAYSPTIEMPMGSTPTWSSGVTAIKNPWATPESQGMVDASQHNVTQWFGSAEGVNYSSKRATVGAGNLFGGEGMGSIIGQ